LSIPLIQLQELMHSLGPSSPWVDSLVQEASDSWTLQTSDGLSVALTFNLETSRIFLSALLGQPEEAHQSAIHETMLCVNLLYAEDHSLRVALTGPSGELMLISEVSLNDWTIASLQECILHFHQHASRLMEEIHVITDVETTPEISERDFLRA
jgi:hypothetical protein